MFTELTVANFSIKSSGAPKEASPISCENWAKAGSANSGACPNNSWQTSGSGVYSGFEGCRIYCVEWKTRKAKPARKSLEDKRPATGRNVKPVQSFKKSETSANCGILSALFVFEL